MSDPSEVLELPQERCALWDRIASPALLILIALLERPQRRHIL